MTIRSNDRVALFIDGANFFAAAKALHIDIDYERLLNYFSQTGYLVRAYYYTAVQDDEEFSPIRPTLDWLHYNGYHVVTKPVRSFFDAEGRRRMKGNMDIELAVDCMELVNDLTHYVIFSGDGDFTALVRALQRKGKVVTIVSTIASDPPVLSDDLRRVTDYYIDLQTIRDIVRRPSSGNVTGGSA